MILVVIYCRVSSDEQAEKDISIPAQRKALRRWVEAQGFQILREFADEGESAYAPANKRPGFMEMITFCRKNKVKYVLVHKLDRFSRNREESILFKSLLRKNGITVKSITENYDPETPQGFLYEGMIEVINQFYSMNLATETIKGMRENAERGFHNGGKTPYGFRLEVTEENGRTHSRLAPGDADQIATVRAMYRMAVEEGLGAKSIARELNRQKIPAPRTRGWTNGTVINILNNPANVGDLVWRRRRTVAPGQLKIAPAHEVVVVPGALEGIIDRETWDRWKQMSAARRFEMPKSREGHAQYLLARLIRCSHCGANYLGRQNKYTTRRGDVRYRVQYQCSSYQSMGPEVCPPYPLRAEWAEGVVLRLLRSRLCSPSAQRELETLVRQKIEARAKSDGSDSRPIERRLEDVERRISLYYKAIGDGLDPAVCRQHIDELTERKVQLQREAAIRKQGDFYQRALEGTLTEIRRIAEAFESDFHSLPLGVQRRVVQHFVEQIEVVDRRLFRVHLRVPMETNGVKLLTDGWEEEEKDGNDGRMGVLPGRSSSVVQDGSTGLRGLTGCGEV